MTHTLKSIATCFGLIAAIPFLVGSVANKAHAEDLELARGAMKMTIQEGWEKVEARSTIIEAEIKVPAAMGDESDGRLTFMAAGGGVEANIERWRSQFSPTADGTAPKSIVKKTEVAGQEVHMVDIVGTFKSQPRGPRGPTVEMADQRMLAAIVVLDNGIEYFVKLVGPKKTVDENAEKFASMINGLKVE